MPKIKRITRREIRRDELFEAIQKLGLYIKKNPNKIKVGGAILGGAFFVLLTVDFLIKRAINTPKEEFSQAVFSYHYSQDEARFSSGMDQFLSFLSKHKKGGLSDIALLYKGVSERGRKEYSTATETLKGLLKKKNNIVSSSALMNLANIEEEKLDYKKAIEYYNMLCAKDDYLKKYAKERISHLTKIKIGTPTTFIP
ncbi:MAG: hypothetical protein AB1397_01270 [bacterium]